MTTYDHYAQRTERILEKAKRLNGVRKKRRIALVSSLSAAAALILAINLTLFVPYTVGGYDLSAYAGNEYYALMEKLATLAYGNPYQTNNFQKWGMDKWVMAWQNGNEAQEPSGGSAGPSGNNGQYVEVTNNQVAGVVEGDLLKRSDRYLYYLSYADAIEKGGDVVVDEKGEPIPDENGNKLVTSYYTEPAKLILNIFTVSGEKVSTYAINDDGFSFNGYGARREMYLTSDCTKILILVPYYDGGARAVCTRLFGVDVSDPADPREFARTSVSGDYVSSRLVGNTLLLISNFKVTVHPDFSEQTQYLPQADGKLLPMEDIVLPEEPSRARYTVLSVFAADTLRASDCEAYFDFSEEVYVSEHHIFTTRERTVVRPQNSHGDVLPPPDTYTDIACTAYDGMSLAYRGELSAYGTIVDQYSLDEYGGVLRVFTTGNEPSCNLYCFDLSDFSLVGRDENFAPGEQVKSARFDGETAYACTAKVTYYDHVVDINDPVFKFDLRDYAHITHIETDEIPGYSKNLITFYGETLLGIGYGENFHELKISVYDWDADKVNPLSDFTVRAAFSEKFKAYFIDAEHGLVGLQITAYDEHKSGYLLLRFDGYRLVELTTVENPVMDRGDARACYIDGTLYIFGTTNTGECILSALEL